MNTSDTNAVMSQSVDTSLHVSNAANNTVESVSTPAPINVAETHQEMGLCDMIGVVALIVTGGLFVYVKKSLGSCQEKIKILDSKIVELKVQVEQTLENPKYNNDIESLSNRLKDVENEIFKLHHSKKEEIKSQPTAITKENNRKEEPKSLPKEEVFYANAQNSRSVVRFVERSMSDTPNSEKMFILNIDANSGQGTYTINPAAEAIILNDLQLFQTFVKPFSFTGSLSNAKIKVKTIGQIKKDGVAWIVTDLLEIDFD